MAGRGKGFDFKWNGLTYANWLEREKGRRLDASAIMVQGHVKDLISKDGTGVWTNKKDKGSVGRLKHWDRAGWTKEYGHQIVNRKTGKSVVQKRGPGLKKHKLAYNAFPSKPGEPPRVQHGRLRASYTWERGGSERRVGTNVKYARPLEKGARHLAPRPHLLRALLEKRAAIRRLMSKPWTPR